MNITQIPLVKHLGIEQEQNTLRLKATKSVQNHIETIHAAAQFTLAETQSGVLLQQSFPQFEERVVPLLRYANVKYKHPGV